MSVLELDRRTIRDALELFRYGYGAARNRARAVRTYAAGRVDYDSTRREVYSYGRHFPLARYVPRKLNGAADTFIVNADIWRQQGPSRTGEHQTYTREVVAGMGARVVLLPFSALDGAGIELDSIRVLAVEPDRIETVEHEARTLAELPRHERRVSYSYTYVRATLDRIPADGREDYRERLEHEPARNSYSDYGLYPLLPGADGLYRYRETRWRDREPDSDGLYRWTTRAHIMGESVISAVRAETVTRPALPFERELETARETVSLRDERGRAYCTGADGSTDTRAHAAGPSGACVYCDSALMATETVRRRGRYVSSFDTNEAPALYFLAGLPRGADVSTVARAVESLAPAAVHAARARGREVARQGDIFLIDTDLTRDELAARGAIFARRTQWTRAARARAGEVTYVAPIGARERRRRAEIELRYARRLWRQRWREEVAARALAHGPDTGRGGAVKARRARELAREEVASQRRALRRVTLAGAELGARYSRSYRRTIYNVELGRYEEVSHAAERRARHLETVTRRRAELETVAARELAGRLTRASGARDGYRSRYGSNALALWRQCLAAAAAKYRPAEVIDSETFTRRRETVRAAVSIYGTAHAATESARVNGAVYVRGTVTHEPDLEPGRRGERDHAPLILTPERWYLAVRNAVPRQSRRRRRRSDGAR